ncbi:MAG: murein L,D-transpeptidase, partial [Bacteroidota bacterium]|nr:murein L,D-transpeptidase [Bacteroidota bacterium]
DTPSEHLFKENERGYSHGCIRVERPLDIAEFLLKDDPSWDRAKFHKYLNLEEPENVILPKEVPVHIVYKTTWVNDDGKVNFLPDIYSHDETQLTSLEKTLKQD